MKTKPSRPFVYLALIMVFLLMFGLIVVGTLVNSNNASGGDNMTSTIIIAINSTTAFHAIQTETAKAVLTPILYTADLSPTAVLQEILTTPIGTSEAASFTQCAYSWAHRDLPNVTTLAQAALANAKIADTTIRADAYGEDCIDPNTNTVRGFGAMTTDFYLTVERPNLSDQTALADYVKVAYIALLTLPADSLPAHPGYLDITFTSGADTKHFRAMFDTIKATLDKNLSGANLLDALGGIQ
ncbi:MAG: hypothetical protein ABI690_03750 [Chloroflexota bacterium]